ncbi:MAG: hypothetical protein AB7S26_34390 [Sandaracinaceae bacterium]
MGPARARDLRRGWLAIGGALLSVGVTLTAPGGARAQAFDSFRELRPLAPPPDDAPLGCGTADGALGPSQSILQGRWRGRLPAGMGPRAGTMPGTSSPWTGLWRLGDPQIWLQVSEDAVRPDETFERFVRERMAEVPSQGAAILGTMELGGGGRAVVVLPDAAWPGAAMPPIAWGFLLSADGLAQSFHVGMTPSAFGPDREGCRAQVLRALATFVDGGQSPVVQGSIELPLEGGVVHVTLPAGEYVVGESVVESIGRTVSVRRLAPRSWGLRRSPALAISPASPGRWAPSQRARVRRGALFGQSVEWTEEVVDFGRGVRDARARATIVLAGTGYDVVVAGATPAERASMARALASARFEARSGL